MGVNHRGRDLFVAEQLLNSANIIPIFQQMRSKTVSKRVAAGCLCDAGSADFIAARHFASCVLGQVVSAFFATARVDRDSIGGKDVLPEPTRAQRWDISDAGPIGR